MAKNTYLIIEMTKLKSLYYLNKSKQNVDSIDRVCTNDSTDNIQYL